MYVPEEYRSDTSEYVDPLLAADELIATALWVRDHALRESGRRVPEDAAQLLFELSAKGAGTHGVYQGFINFKPTKNWVAHKKQKMVQELLLNQEEMSAFEQRLDN